MVMASVRTRLSISSLLVGRPWTAGGDGCRDGNNNWQPERNAVLFYSPEHMCLLRRRCEDDDDDGPTTLDFTSSSCLPAPNEKFIQECLLERRHIHVDTHSFHHAQTRQTENSNNKTASPKQNPQ